jgi:hypothetical protein
MKTKPTTIADDWTRFAASVLPPNVSDIQRSEMRRAFYGGVAVMFDHAYRLGDPDGSEADAVAMLERIRAEIQLFSRLVAEGRA